jgi:1,4-dihydroxy-2-naphthoate octaprenyltransferase
MHENIFTKKIGKYWTRLAILTIIVGITPVIIGLSYRFNQFYYQVGYTVTLFFIVFYIIIAFFSIYLGYKLRTWENINVKI